MIFVHNTADNASEESSGNEDEETKAHGLSELKAFVK